MRIYVQRLGTGAQTVLLPNGIYLFDAFKAFADGRTLLFCDPRNRGRSDHLDDPSKLERGIHHDVDDLEAVRRHFGSSRVDLIGHSYMGLTVALYGMKFPDRTGRIIQIGSVAPEHAKQYPVHLTNVDATFGDVMARLGELHKQRAAYDAQELCRKFWSILRVLYVADPADAWKVNWERCDLPNELNFMKQWNEHVLPSMQSLHLTPEEFAKAKAPVLVIHGRKDRSASYGGGRDWALRLPNARLVTLDNAAHAPWMEYPDAVFGAGETFAGAWLRQPSA